jgi:hypothetical protein
MTASAGPGTVAVGGAAPAPALTMLGDDDTATCADDACAIPGRPAAAADRGPAQ